MHAAPRPHPDDHAPDFADYVAAIGHTEDVMTVLAGQLDELSSGIGQAPEARGNYRYAPGKWSLKEVLGHLADTERVYSYRALWIARGETTPAPPYDDQPWATRTGAERRSLADMVEEWTHVRRATLALYRALAPEDWERRALAGDAPITVRALAFVIAGHTRHHLEVLRARYLA